MDPKSGPTFENIARIVVRERRSRNYARIGLRSEVTVVRSEETIGKFVGIDATYVMTFVIFDGIVVMLGEVELPR